MIYIRMREWHDFYKNAGVPGIMYEGGSGRAYVRLREWQVLYNNVGVAGIM